MKKLVVLIAALALTAGCSPDREVVEIIKGDDGAPGADGSNGESCTAEESEGGVTIICGENVFYISNGQDGEDGEDGEDGTGVTNITSIVNVNNVTTINCSVAPVVGGAEITCGEDVVFVADGEDASDDGSSSCSLEASDSPNQYLLTCNGLTVELTSTGGSSPSKGGGGK